MQAIAATANEPDRLIAAAEVLDMRFSSRKKQTVLSLRAAKLLHFMIKIAGVKATESVIHRFPISELNFSKLSHKEFLETCQELMTTVIQLTLSKDGEIYDKSGPLLFDVELERKGDGEIRFRISPTLRKALSDSNRWAALSRQVTLAFESRYSLRLYEILAIRRNLDHKHDEVFPIEDLRERLGVPPGKLPEWFDLRRFAIDPAIKEVNEITDVEVAYEPIKRGRSVTAIRLFWQDRPKATAPKIEAPKSRTAAKPKPAEDAPPAEANAGGFPDSGSIQYGRWKAIAKAELTIEKDLDVDIVANAFRIWARGKRIPFDDPTIEGSFRSFCNRFIYKG